MTKRQAHFHQRVIQQRDQILAAVRAAPRDVQAIGMMLIVRLLAEYTVSGVSTSNAVLVRRDADGGLSYCENSLRFFRKGVSEPRWRRLVRP